VGKCVNKGWFIDTREKPKIGKKSRQKEVYMKTNHFISAAIIAVAITFTFNACSGGNDGGDNNNPIVGDTSSSSSDGFSQQLSSTQQSSSSITPSSSSIAYCYGYLNYRDCNLIGGKWITDEQHCFSGGGNIVNTDYCNQNGIGIDNTPSDQISSSSETQCVPNYGQMLTPGSQYCTNSSSSQSSSSSSSSIMQSSSSQQQSSSSIVGCTATDNTSTQYCSNGTMKTYGTITYEGQTYKTVVIGEQTWMAENLNYAVTGSKCGNVSTGTLSDANTATCDKYGRLYDWATAMTVCPTGWHLLSNADLDRLMSFVDGSSGTGPYGDPITGKYLKAIEGWNIYSGIENLDAYGFSALPGGYGSGGGFYGVGNGGYWWRSTELDSNHAGTSGMGYNNEYVVSGSEVKSYLYSVRCVQD
jgi:uncharacterized protein (TIGR02145 family)